MRNVCGVWIYKEGPRAQVRVFFINYATDFMAVPLFDLTRQYAALRAEIEPVALELLASGAYVLGPAVETFERHAAQALGSAHAVGLANGTDALLLALRAIGLQAGDEVITTPFTFYSAAEVVALLGAKPVFVDIEDETFNLDPAQIEAAITPRTRAIIPVHLFGHPAAMPAIMAIAKRHDLRVIEDCAQSWGATLDGKQTGTWGDAGTFSFFPTKNLGSCGEGGLLCSDDSKLSEKTRQLRVHGQSQRYVYDELGYNSRLHALQAAILDVKLRHVDAWNDARREHAAHYAQLLAGTPYVVPIERAGARHIYHQYTLRLPAPLDREHISRVLDARGIGHAIYYPVSLHLQPVFADLGYHAGDLPVSERVTQEVLSLPIFPELRADEVEAVGAALCEALN